MRCIKGKYGDPIPINQAILHWVNDDWFEDKNYNCDELEKHPCEYPKHLEWGKGRRNGQKLNYPTSQMFVQFWQLTDDEFAQAVENYDMFSLDMPPRLICENCAHKINMLRKGCDLSQ